MPMSRRSGGTAPVASDKSFDPTVIDPLDSGSRPAIMRSVVVLPHPLGPIRDTMEPFGTSIEMPRTAS
jgi:hypothetical protein